MVLTAMGNVKRDTFMFYNTFYKHDTVILMS